MSGPWYASVGDQENQNDALKAHLGARCPNAQTERLRLGHADADQVILKYALQLHDVLHSQDVFQPEVVVLKLRVLQEFVEGVDVGGGGPIVAGAGSAARRRRVARQGRRHLLTRGLKGCATELELFSSPPFVVGEAERKISRILVHHLTGGQACTDNMAAAH